MPVPAASSQPKLWTVRVETSPKLSEIIADILGETALAITVMAPPRKPTTSIEAIYDTEPDRSQLTAMLAVAVALHKEQMPELRIEAVPDLNWLRKVASDFPPLPAARWIIYGAHHKEAAPRLTVGYHKPLQIDATSAFGTGEHPTTFGCLLMLARFLKTQPLAKPGSRRMLDMGCGSGILAMAWAKVHQGQALGVDCDALSVSIAQSNARANGLLNRVRIVQGLGYGRHIVKQKAPYDLIMANIFAGPLAMTAKDLKRNLRPGGLVILSGILNHQTNRVLAAYRMQKVFLVKCFRLGEWSVLVLKRRPS